MPLNVKNVSFDLFSVVMGITGLGLAWRAAASDLGLPSQIGESILAVGLLAFVILLSCQLIRLFFFTANLVDEWKTPARRNYFCTASISGSLLAISLLPYSLALSRGIWIAAALAQLLFLIFTIRRWVIDDTGHHEIGPSWLIPMVGNASPSFAGSALGFAPFSNILLAFAISCWLMFMPLIIYRIIFVQPKTAHQAIPGLAITISAPAVMSIALYSAYGHANEAVQFMAWAALFLAIVILSLGRRLTVAPFSKNWWAFTFPSTALASALIKVDSSVPNAVNHALAWISLTMATGIVIYIVYLSSFKTFFTTLTIIRGRRANDIDCTD